MTKAYWLLGGGAVLLLLSWILPGLVAGAATTDVETEEAVRQASVELLHPTLAAGPANPESAEMGAARQLIAQQEAAAAQQQSRGQWTRFVLGSLGMICLAAGVVVFYTSKES